MDEYHALITERDSTIEVLQMKFVANSDKQAVKKICNIAEALNHDKKLAFIYHRHREITLNQKQANT